MQELQEKNIQLQEQLQSAVKMLDGSQSHQGKPLDPQVDTSEGQAGEAWRGRPEQTEEPETEYGTVQHPGVRCRSRTYVARDPARGACRVSVETTALRDGRTDALGMEDMVALASQAALAASAEFARERGRQQAASSHSEACMGRHRDICAALREGAVLRARWNGKNQFGHVSFVVHLEAPSSGRDIKAIFKPRVEGDAQGWHRTPIEAVAYKLNLLLGMDYVPPVVYRTGGLELAGETYEEGALIYFSHNSTELREHCEQEWGVSRDVLLSDTRILDVLLHNSDRHHGHFLLGEHWAVGDWRDGAWQGKLCPVLIDHAAGFRREASVTLMHENAFQTGPVRCIRARTYLRLRFLDAAAIAGSFSRFLSEREMRDLLVRRNMILRYFDDLVEQQGYRQTVIEA